jgi:hypothetical protein
MKEGGGGEGGREGGRGEGVVVETGDAGDRERGFVKHGSEVAPVPLP